MTTQISTRIILAFVLMMTMAALPNLHAQSKITAFGSAGISNIEVNGLGFLDLLDPYIKPVAQYTAGIQYERELSRHFAFMTGGQYTSRGFGAKETFNVDMGIIDLPVNASLETRINYLEVPVMLKYIIGEGGVQPYIKAGASTAYAISGKIQPKVNAIINWNLPSININLENDMYNRLDVSGVVGAGISIPTNETGAIQFDLTYRHSLNDMFLDKITDIRIKSHGLSAGVGYTMRF
ncbi:MAG: porin family protein [Saprospiraceae bacterium]